MKNQASVVASALSGLGSLKQEEVEQVLQQLDISGLNRVIVTSDAGLILYDSTENEDDVGSYSLLSEVVLALEGKDVFRSEFTEDAFRSRAAVPVMYRGVLLGCVYIYEYDSEQAILLNGLTQNLIRLSAAVIVVSAAVSFLLSNSLTKRINRLLYGIQKTGDGGEAQKVEIGGSDEVRVLAEEFNQLTERLNNTESVRRRFVSDASHELKTPLASIRLLSDSILQTDGIDMDTVKEFVGDIGDEAERLTRITQKLLVLTRLDADAVTNQEELSLAELTDRVVHMLSPLAEEKQIELRTDLKSDCVITANPDEMYEVIFNLSENGIKYNHQGGWVCITAEESEGLVRLRFEDSGIGIPEDERERIFERFYRVDKARSREAGGTGLGLSIVRDILKRYGGSVRAESRESGGTRFLVEIPKRGAVV